MKASEQMTFEDLMRDETLQRAFSRSIQIIGDAAKLIPEEIKDKQPEIEWKQMSGMRDVVVHNYLGVDYQIVWDVIQNHIPRLLKKVLKVLNSRRD